MKNTVFEITGYETPPGRSKLGLSEESFGIISGRDGMEFSFGCICVDFEGGSLEVFDRVDF